MSKRILVIDDEESIRFTFQYLLADLGYEVEVAGTPDEGLSLFTQSAFDLVFLDLLLGTMSGINTLRDLKEVNPQIPVVMVTGAPDEQSVCEAIKLGAFAYIPKPVRQDKLLEMTERAITSSQQSNRPDD